MAAQLLPPLFVYFHIVGQGMSLSRSYKERLYISRMGVVDCVSNRLSWSLAELVSSSVLGPWIRGPCPWAVAINLCFTVKLFILVSICITDGKGKC